MKRGGEINIAIIMIFILAICFAVYVSVQNKQLKLKLAAKQEQMKEMKGKSKLYSLEEFIRCQNYSEQFIGTKFPLVIAEDIEGNRISTDFSIPGKGIILLFSSDNCDVCFVKNLKLLKKINNNIKDSVLIMVFSDMRYEELLKIKKSNSINYSIIYDKNHIISYTPIINKTPLLLFVNEYNTIIDAFFAPIGFDNFLYIFYSRLETHMGISNKVFNDMDFDIVKAIKDKDYFNVESFTH